MSKTKLLSAVKAGLYKAATFGYSSSSAAHDIFEAYVLTLLLTAADNAGWLWELRDTSGAKTTKAVFRLAPGRLPAGNYTHILLTKSGKSDLEAHIGVKVKGDSQVRHEFDLLVVCAQHAKYCRSYNQDPDCSEVVAHAEAKFHGGDITLPLGRAYLGLAADCSLPDKSVLVTNQNGYSTEKLLDHYGLLFRFFIKPTNPVGEYHLIKSFEQFLRAAP